MGENIFVFLVAGAVWVEVARIGSLTLVIQVGRVVPVLHLHASVVAQVHDVAPCRLLSEVVLHPHVHVESLISLLLAVLDAGELTLLLGRHEVNLNAVLVALLEEHLRQGVLLQGVHRIVWISRPVAVVHISLFFLFFN